MLLLCALVSCVSAPRHLHTFAEDQQVEAERKVRSNPKFASRAEPSCTLSFLSGNYVPQGMAALPDKTLLIAAYIEDGDSCLFHIDAKGRTSPMSVMESKQKPHRGHVGGLALVKSGLWIASSGQLLRVPLKAANVSGSNTLIATHVLDLPHAASIATYYDGYVYIGEFAKFSIVSKPMLYKYSEADLLSGIIKPVASYPLPIKAQGITISNSGVYVACSYSSKLSKLYFSEDLSSLANAELIARLPAGAEGLACVSGTTSIIVVFESAALKYRDRWSRNGATITDWVWEYRP